MMVEEKQRPIYYVAESSLIENIKIAIDQRKFNAAITELVNTADSLLAVKYNKSNLIDIECLADAAKKVCELISLDPNNKDIPRLSNKIDIAAKAYFQPTINWIANNMEFARRKINDIEPGLYERKLPYLIQILSFDSLQKIDPKALNILIYLCAEVADNTHFRSVNDSRLIMFREYLRALIYNRGEG